MWSESWGELWPVSPSPASSAVSLAALPGPRPHAASRSSARPAARSTCSSWGCPSSDQRCVPSDANKREYSQSTFHHVLHFEKKKKKKERKPDKDNVFIKNSCWCSPASALPGLWLAASALSGRSELPPLSASPQSAPLEDAPHWCHLVATSSSKEAE